MAKFFYKFYIGDSRMSAEKFLPRLKHFFNAVCFYIKRGKCQSQERLSRETLLSESLPKAVLGDGTVTRSRPAKGYVRRIPARAASDDICRTARCSSSDEPERGT